MTDAAKKTKLSRARRLLERRRAAHAAGQTDPLSKKERELLKASKADLLREARRAALEKKYAAGRRLSPLELVEIGQRGDSAATPIEAQGLAGIAREIAHLLKIQCSREYVREWKTRTPPFPHPKENNLYNVAECVDWVRANILSARNGHGEHDLFQRAASERARGDIAAEDHKAWQREVERGAWIKKSDHARALANAARIVQTLFDREVEIDGPRAGADILRNLGVGAETISSWQRQMVAHGAAFLDRRRREFSRHIPN